MVVDFVFVGVGYFGVGIDNGKGNFGYDFVVFGNCFFVIKFIFGFFEDLDFVVFDVGKNL